MKRTLLLSTLLALTTGASPAAVTLTNLLAYYDFEGDTNNVAGLAPNASLATGASISTTAAGYDGVGEALVMNATNGGAFTGTGTHFDSAFTDDKMTVSYWSYDTAASDSAVSFKIVTPGANGRGFQTHAPWSNNQVYLDHSGANSAPGTRLQVGPGVLPINQWNHWVFQKDGANREIFLNGSSIGSNGSGNPLTSFTGVLHIGSDGNGTVQDGRIDDFAVWDDVLDSTQITSLASGTSVAQLLGIPEPSSTGVLMLLAASLGLRRRRR